MASTPSSSLAALSCSTTVSLLESFLTLTGFFEARMSVRVSVAEGAGVLLVAGVAGGLGAEGVSGAAALGAAGGLSAAGALGAAGVLGAAASVALTIQGDATIANTTTPAAMNGKRCFGANDRSKPPSLRNLSKRRGR